MASLAVVLAALLVPAAGGADPASELRAQAGELQRLNEALAAEAGAAAGAVSGLDSQLVATRAELVRLRSRAEVLDKRQESARASLGAARRSLGAAQRGLAHRLRTLYEQGEVEPLAVLLGAESLDEAVTRIENLELMASEDEAFIARAEAARKQLTRLTRTLAAREAENEELRAQASEAVAALLAARQQRAVQLARLGAARNANLSEIGALEARARSLAVRTPVPLLAPAAPTGSLPAPSGATRTLTVVATGYAFPGTTATGVPVGPGIVAVDPSVIPLGTRMMVPGYGQAVAADTGGAVRGAHIDLWFPSVAAARAWGRRTVTITLYG